MKCEVVAREGFTERQVQVGGLQGSAEIVDRLIGGRYAGLIELETGAKSFLDHAEEVRLVVSIRSFKEPKSQVAPNSHAPPLGSLLSLLISA